jgi:hypothetical protein
MGIGTILNINPKGALKASTTVATAATKTLTHMVQKEAVDVAATVASKNVSKATPWFKSFNPYNQVTQKTSQVVEKCLEKGGLKHLSHSTSNPLHATEYTKKALHQMKNNAKTGQPDFHGFPKIVDNFASLGKKNHFKRGDGLIRTKITLEGGYKGLDGHFEWIIEADNMVNHRIFVPYK